jgi:hypothetical protein
MKHAIQSEKNNRPVKKHDIDDGSYSESESFQGLTQPVKSQSIVHVDVDVDADVDADVQTTLDEFAVVAEYKECRGTSTTYYSDIVDTFVTIDDALALFNEYHFYDISTQSNDEWMDQTLFIIRRRIPISSWYDCDLSDEKVFSIDHMKQDHCQ